MVVQWSSRTRGFGFRKRCRLGISGNSSSCSMAFSRVGLESLRWPVVFRRIGRSRGGIAGVRRRYSLRFNKQARRRRRADIPRHIRERGRESVPTDGLLVEVDVYLLGFEILFDARG